jgi:hypothetical protein
MFEQNVQYQSPGAKDAVERYLNKRESKPNVFQNMRERSTKGIGNLLKGTKVIVKKYWWVFVILALVGGAVAYFGTGHTVKPPTISLRGNTHLEIPLLSLGLFFLFIFSLLETNAWHDPLLLDFFAAWFLVAILVFGQLFGHDSPGFWITLGAVLFAMVIGTIYNPNAKAKAKWWNRIDTTHWYVAGVALIFIYLMHSQTISYPSYLPIVVPILIAVIGIGKEFFRQTALSLIAFAVGIIPAVTQNVFWIVIGFIITMSMAAIGAQKGWIAPRGTSHTIPIGKHKEFIVAWDLALFYLIEVVLIGYAIYHNYPVFAIGK